jgi:aspartate carbamoyltransferase catalytic subunit
MKIIELTELNDTVFQNSDILYVTRIQKERFSDPQEYEKVKGVYTIDSNILKRFKPDISIMHPLPRIDEISQDVDSNSNAIYFKQASYGKDLRSALLALILNESPLYGILFYFILLFVKIRCENSMHVEIIFQSVS